MYFLYVFSSRNVCINNSLTACLDIPCSNTQPAPGRHSQKEYWSGAAAILFKIRIYFIADTRSNSSWISCDGAAVARLTATFTASATRNAGSSS